MTPEHYRVRELTMQVAEVEKALQKEKDNLVNRLKSDVEASLHREGMVSEQYAKQAAKVSLRDDKLVRYNMVQRDVDSQRRLYETLLQRVGEVGLAAAMRTSTITVVDQATAPLSPYSPNMMASVGIGFFGGATLGLVLALVRFRSDRTIRYPGEASFHLQIRELGVIPSVRGRGLKLLRSRDNVKKFQQINPSPGLIVPDNPEEAIAETTNVPAHMPAQTRLPVRSVALATWLRIPEMAEAFFGAVNSLVFSGKEGTGGRVIVLTSPEVGDGKTTVATNLAIAMAQIGRKVVLVDGDLRKPRLHSVFGEDPSNGLAKILEGDDPIEKRPLEQFVCKTEIPNLSIIPTKPVHDGVSTKLHSVRLRTLLERLRGEFDVVIIDCPPVLHISDARVFGWLSDGVLLVFRAGKTTKEAALTVHDTLMQDGIRVLGTILNDWKPRKGERYATYSSYFRVA